MNQIQELNQKYWNDNAESWFGCTALPNYGVRFETEDELKLFDDLKDLIILDIGCGSGHSLKYCGDRGASELWGIDISDKQLGLAEEFLSKCNYKSQLFNTPMEECSSLPRNYFDVVYSIYAIGWSTDLNQTFSHVYDLLKPGGYFIFSWQHPLHRSVKRAGDEWVIQNSYHDESYYDLEIDQQPVKLASRKLSTYINHLVQAGLMIEYLSEDSHKEVFKGSKSDDLKSEKASLVPLSFVIKVRKPMI